MMTFYAANELTF
jgi:hypothetical protein